MKTKILVSAVVFFLLLSQAALAIPATPNQFHGTATISGREANDGAEVSAVIDGEVVKTVEVEDGYYNLIVDDPDSDRSGEEVSFLIEGADTGQSETFQNGGIDRIDLTVTIDDYWETDSGDTTGSASGSGSGGSGGGFAGVATEEETTDEEDVVQDEDEGEVKEEAEDICRERWVCTEWSECEDGFQTRECSEVNECGTDLYEPHEIQPCVTTDEGPAEQSVTGAFLSTPVIAGIGILLISGLGAIWFLKPKR